MSAMLGRALPPIPGQDGSPTNMDFLLPTGVMVPMVCSPRNTLREVKDLLYQEAKQYPLYSLLKDQGFYNFMGRGYMVSVKSWPHLACPVGKQC